jgi:hypothetical protein
VHELKGTRYVQLLSRSQVRRGEAALDQGRANEPWAASARRSRASRISPPRSTAWAYAAQGQNVQALWGYDKYLRLAPDAAEIRQSIRELKGRADVGAK